MFSCPAQAAHYYAKLVKRPVGEMSCNDNDGLVHCEPRNKAGEAAAAVRGCHQSSVRPPDHNCKGSGMMTVWCTASRATKLARRPRRCVAAISPV